MGRKKKIKELTLFSEEELNELMVDFAASEDNVANENIEEENKLSNATIIRNISYDQTEILHNIGQLYNEGSDQFDADMTASSLVFYNGSHNGKYIIPEPKILMDVYPQRDDIIKITPFQKLPLEDKSIHSLICDLPFVISPKTCKSVVEKKEGANMVSNRFSSFYPAEELFENIYWWEKEAFRVLDDGGILIWKMQSTVSGGRQLWSVPFSFISATKLGFYPIDEFILQAKARLVAASKIKKQMHARKYTSTFFVFKKDEKKARKNNCLTILKNCEQNVFEGKVWDVK